MRFTKILTLTLIVCAVSLLSITGCGPKSNVVTLKMAHGLDVTHPVHKAMKFMAENAWTLSDSTLKIDIYPNEQLGNEKECLEQLQMGSLAMTKVSTSGLEAFVPEVSVYALPFLFRDADHCWKVLESPIGKELLQAGSTKGLTGLCYYDAGARSFYTVKKPILSPEDLKGMKIRTQQSAMAIDMIDALGGSATPISWGELYTSLQQGVVDGAENNPPSLFTANHFEVCKHYSLNEHTMVPDVVIISTIVWNKMSEEHKAVLQKAADLSVPYQKELWAAFVQESMEKMQAAGLNVYHPDKKPFIEKAKTLWAKFDGTKVGDLAQQILEVE